MSPFYNFAVLDVLVTTCRPQLLYKLQLFYIIHGSVLFEAGGIVQTPSSLERYLVSL